MRQFYYTAINIALVFILVSCGAPKDAPYDYDYQRTTDNAQYGTFGDNDDVTVLSLDGSSKDAAEKEKQLQAQKREEERRLEQKRKELVEARNERERQKEREREENRKRERERLSNTDSDVATAPTVKQSTVTNQNYSNSAASYSDAVSNTRRNNYQYSNTIYPTKAKLKVVNKADESKLKRYNVVVASLLMEEGANKLMEALKKANEPYFVAKSGSYFTFIVGSFDKKEDAVAYRVKILDKYPRKHSEEELFQTYGIIFSDTWLLEAI